MDLDEKELNVLSTLVALGKSNPQNSQIQNMIVNKFMEASTPKQTEQQRMKDILAQGYASRIASGEGDSTDLLGDFESLLTEDDASPVTTLKNRLSKKTTDFNAEEIPDDMRDTAVANKYQLLYNKATQSGNYTDLENFKAQNPSYEFTLDEKGVASANPKEYSLTSKFAQLFGGDEAGKKSNEREQLQSIIDEFYNSKYGLLGNETQKLERLQGLPSLQNEDAKSFLKKKGVKNNILKSIGVSNNSL